MVYGDNPYKMAHGTLMPSIHAIMQSNNLYVYCMNNPIRYVDPNGLSAWLIHGTWADKRDSKFTDEMQAYIEDLFGENAFAESWSGGNSKGAREIGAKELFNAILRHLESNPDDPVRLIGHSHGGNIAILVANMLAKEGIRVETLITIATPVRGDYQLDFVPTIGPLGSSALTNVNQHINIYNRGDGIQTGGGSIWNGGEAGRTFKNANNVEIPVLRHRRIYNHEFMHNDKATWESYIRTSLGL